MESIPGHSSIPGFANRARVGIGHVRRPGLSDAASHDVFPTHGRDSGRRRSSVVAALCRPRVFPTKVINRRRCSQSDKTTTPSVQTGPPCDRVYWQSM